MLEHALRVLVSAERVQNGGVEAAVGGGDHLCYVLSGHTSDPDGESEKEREEGRGSEEEEREGWRGGRERREGGGRGRRGMRE